MVDIQRLFLFCVIFLSTNFVFSSNSLAALSCEIKDTCTAPDVTVFKISSGIFANAHAELPTQTNYLFKVCCKGVDTLGSSCSGNYVEVLRLSSETNAHVEEATVKPLNYNYPVCLSASSDHGLTCGYSTDCSKLGKRYVCLASISGETNAHIGDCSPPYSIKVCCKVLSNYDFEIRSVKKITGTVGEPFELKVDIENVGAKPDSYSVSFTSANPNIIEISNPNPTTAEIRIDQLTFASTLIRPLTTDDNVVTIRVTSVNKPSLSKVDSIPLRTAKFSLPEFGVFGFLQIIAIAAVLYLTVRLKSKAS